MLAVGNVGKVTENVATCVRGMDLKGSVCLVGVKVKVTQLL